MGFKLGILLLMLVIIGCSQKPTSVSLRGEEFHGRREFDESQEYYLSKDEFAGQSGQTNSRKVVVTEVEGNTYSAKKINLSEVTCPFILPINGEILSKFSKAASTLEEGEDMCGDGIIIAAQEGAAITASAAGRVIYVGKGLRWHGNLVIIEHPHNVITLYSYLHKISVQTDDQVKQGQVIGSIGKLNSNVKNTASQMCFTMHRNGQPVDPLKNVNCSQPK